MSALLRPFTVPLTIPQHQHYLLRHITNRGYHTNLIAIAGSWHHRAKRVEYIAFAQHALLDPKATLVKGDSPQSQVSQAAKIRTQQMMDAELVNTARNACLAGELTGREKALKCRSWLLTSSNSPRSMPSALIPDHAAVFKRLSKLMAAAAGPDFPYLMGRDVNFLTNLSNIWQAPTGIRAENVYIEALTEVGTQSTVKVYLVKDFLVTQKLKSCNTFELVCAITAEWAVWVLFYKQVKELEHRIEDGRLPAV